MTISDTIILYQILHILQDLSDEVEKCGGSTNHIDRQISDLFKMIVQEES